MGTSRRHEQCLVGPSDAAYQRVIRRESVGKGCVVSGMWDRRSGTLSCLVRIDTRMDWRQERFTGRDKMYSGNTSGMGGEGKERKVKEGNEAGKVAGREGSAGDIKAAAKALMYLLSPSCNLIPSIHPSIHPLHHPKPNHAHLVQRPHPSNNPINPPLPTNPQPPNQHAPHPHPPAPRPPPRAQRQRLQQRQLRQQYQILKLELSGLGHRRLLHSRAASIPRRSALAPEHSV